MLDPANIYFLALIIAIALTFEFLNGMNDAANSVATIVSTRVLTPVQAVVFAAVCNFVAIWFFGLKVAQTVGKGIVEPAVITQPLIGAAVFAAMFWTWICTRLGLPISVSHALIGGLAGAGVARGGFGVLIGAGIAKVTLFIFLAPVIGCVGGHLFMKGINWLCGAASPGRVNGWFRRLQLLSAGWFSVGHGGNDAQKTMGIIAVLLWSSGYLGDEFFVPRWVIVTCYVVIALGTLAGGWRVVHTMGIKLTRLAPVGGFSAETGAAITLTATALLGIPVSTTHTIAGAILGVGLTRRASAVRWGVATRIVYAWILTIPATGLISALTYWAMMLLPWKSV